MLKTRAHIERDTEQDHRLRARSCSPSTRAPTRRTTDMREALRGQAAKRVAIRFEVVETVSWDHSKLGGVY